MPRVGTARDGAVRIQREQRIGPEVTDLQMGAQGKISALGGKISVLGRKFSQTENLLEVQNETCGGAGNSVPRMRYARKVKKLSRRRFDAEEQLARTDECNGLLQHSSSWQQWVSNWRGLESQSGGEDVGRFLGGEKGVVMILKLHVPLLFHRLSQPRSLPLARLEPNPCSHAAMPATPPGLLVSRLCHPNQGTATVRADTKALFRESRELQDTPRHC
jgi:hypothetical protein